MKAHEIDWPEDDSRTGTVRTPYSIGIFGGRRELQGVIAFGRSVGLDITDHHDGGWIVRSGWLVARGPAGALRQFVAALDQLKESS